MVTPDTPTDNSSSEDTLESGNSRTSLPVYVLAGVCGVIVIILTLITVVVCVIALVRKSKKSSSAQVERLVSVNSKVRGSM